jgi:uncharacterized protein
MAGMILRDKPEIGKPVFKAASIKITDEQKRTFDVIASDETPDRYGDIVRAKGWSLQNFRKNPVLLFGHQSSEPPIGTVPQVNIKGTQLMAGLQFLPEGVYEFADTIWRIVLAGALRAVSVGFLPTAEPNLIRDEKNDNIIGFEYVEQELLELSVVPVPANPAALALTKSLQLNREFVKRVFVEESASAYLLQRKREIDMLRLRVSG